MAKTSTQIYEELALLAHPLFVETAPGRAVLKALAHVLSKTEVAWDESGGWLEQMFRQTATEEWLELHGENNGVKRRGGEDLEAYRARATQRATELTETELARLTGEWLALQGEGYSAMTVDPYDAVLDDGFFLGTEMAMLTQAIGEHGRPKYLAWIHLPMPEVRQPLEGFHLNEDAFLGDEGALGEDIRSVERPYLRGLLEELEPRQVRGVGYGITIDDYWQDAYAPLLT